MSSYIPADPDIAEFAAYLRLERGQSPRTSEEYARDVELFGEFLEPGHLKGTAFSKLSAITVSEVRRFVMELMGAAKRLADLGAPQDRRAAVVLRLAKT